MAATHSNHSVGSNENEDFEDEWYGSEEEEEDGDEVDMPPPCIIRDQGDAIMFLAKAIILMDVKLSAFSLLYLLNFLKNINPVFRLPVFLLPESLKKIKNQILRIHDVERPKMLKVFKNIPGRIAITTDVWICENKYDKFMEIAAHFIDDNWVLQSRKMRFMQMDFPECEEWCADALMECFRDWNVDCKLSTLTVDCCINSFTMFQNLLDKLSPTSLILGGKMCRMHCFTRALNLMVKDCLELIGESIERIRDSVRYWTLSKEKRERFARTAHQLNISYSKKLVLDLKIYWNSTYLMLTTALQCKSVFSHLEQCETEYKCDTKVPGERDWELVEQTCDKLKLLYEATKMFYRTKYATTNHFFPTLCGIKLSLSKWVASPFDEIQMMVEKLKTEFEKYWSETYEVMLVATVLDPRFKIKFFEYIFPQIHGDDSSLEMGRVRGIILQLMKEYRLKSRLCEENRYCNNLSSTFPQSGGVHSGKEVDPLLNFDLFVTSTTSAASTIEDAKTELEYYLIEKVLPRTCDFNILTWWKENGIKYPTLCDIARDILAIPVSAIASDYAFKVDGKFLDNREAFRCAQDWLWPDMGDSCSTRYRGCCSSYEDADDESEEDEDEEEEKKKKKKKKKEEEKKKRRK